MTCSGSLASLAQLLSTSISGQPAAETFSGVSTDTRQLRSGNLFVAIAGERFDGHDYSAEAFQKGAVAAIASRPLDGPYLLVPDTLVAYQTLARWWRSQFAIPVLAITGSAGKTSTKELLAAALSAYGTVLKTEANFNNDLGVPLTLLQLDQCHDFAVVEMAMRGPGEIARLAGTALPTHGLITNVGTAHIGRLGSREAIAKAKCELLQSLDPQAGVALLNGEDELLQTTAARVWSGKTLRFGLDRDPFPLTWQPHPSVLQWGDRRFPVPLAGRHQALNYAAVLVAIDGLGLDLDPLQQGIALPAQLSGRNRVLMLPDGVEILDETYNAAPEAMVAALQVLCQSGDRRHWAVLGPMRELGDAAPELYAAVGAIAAQLELAGICLFDPEAEMESLVQALPGDRVYQFGDRDELAQWLAARVEGGDRILFKAARSIALETVLQRFVAQRYPERELTAAD